MTDGLKLVSWKQKIKPFNHLPLKKDTTKILTTGSQKLVFYFSS